MKFKLEGEVLLSKDADEALDDITNLLKKQTTNYFLRNTT
jgi:hypothetical protein